MTIQETIQKAIDGGWKKEFVVEPMDTPQANFAKAMIDPLFWQALGKAMGWKDSDECGSCKCPVTQEAWYYHWHRFVDHLAKDRSIESFFEQL